MKRIFIVLALMVFTGTMVVSAVEAMTSDVVTEYSIPDEDPKKASADKDGDADAKECDKKAETKKACDPGCTKTCCAKKSSCGGKKKTE